MSDTFLSAKKIHLVGIKGAGMTALAEILVKRGVRVTGSDTEETFFTDKILGSLGIIPQIGFAPEHIPSDAELIVYSTVYQPEINMELQAALESGRTVLTYPEALGELMQEKIGLAVCGTHGKTTTSALLAHVLKEAGVDPLAVVGSRILSWQGNALFGEGKYFIVEADEYQNKFQYYSPLAVILTSLDWDHPDFFPDMAAYQAVFREFVKKIPTHGFLVSWGDSTVVSDVATHSSAQKVFYGFLDHNDFRVENYVVQANGDVRQSFSVRYGETDLGTFALRLAGKHNALNATAVIALCVLLKIDIEKVRESLSIFPGTERRFEYIGAYKGALLYDDFAHHPEEIKVTLEAFRELYPDRRLIAIFHPHTFTRTEALLSEFSQSFELADEVLVLDIYGSAREERGSVTSQDLVDLINTYKRGKASVVKNIQEALEAIESRIGENDVIVTLGAGNVWEVTHTLAKQSA